MLENLLRFIVKVGEKEAYLIFQNSLSISDLENIALQFLQFLGKHKEVQAQAEMQKAQEESSKVQSKVEPIEGSNVQS